MEEGKVQVVPESKPMKTMKDVRNTKKHQRHHFTLAPFVILSIIIAHLLTFRMFSFALINLEAVKAQVVEEVAPVVTEPVSLDASSTDESRQSVVIEDDCAIGNMTYSINETSS